MGPYQGLRGSGEKGHLFSGILGESIITFWGFREQRSEIKIEFWVEIHVSVFAQRGAKIPSCRASIMTNFVSSIFTSSLNLNIDPDQVNGL